MHAQNLLFRMLRPAVDRPSTSCRKPRVRGDNQGGWGRQLGWIVAGAVPDRRPACDFVTTCRTAGVLNSREETPSARHAHHRSAGEIVRAGAAVGGAGSLLGGCSARRALLWRRPRFRAGLGGLAGRAANRAASAVSGGRIAAKRGVVGNPLARRLARRRTGGGPGGTAGLLRLCERRERECAREQGPAGEIRAKRSLCPPPCGSGWTSSCSPAGSRKIAWPSAGWSSAGWTPRRPMRRAAPVDHREAMRRNRAGHRRDPTPGRSRRVPGASRAGGVNNLCAAVRHHPAQDREMACGWLRMPTVSA